MRKITNNKGFTIIEVVLVLAIAAVIFLIVFLAVPALQRNNRNNQRKSEVGRLLAGYSEYVNNNPTTTTGTITPANVTDMAGTVNLFNGNVQVGNTSGSPTVDQVRIVAGGTCTGTGMAVTTSTSIRKVAAQFNVETAGTPQAMCQNG